MGLSLHGSAKEDGMTTVRRTKVQVDTRARIVEAATKLFFSRGYNDVRVAEIAAAAQSNIASVNYHFGSKESLFTDIFAAECEKVASARATRLDSLLQRNAQPTVAEVVQAWLDPVFENLAVTESRIIFTHLMGLVLWSDVNDQIKETLSQSLAVVDHRFLDVLTRIRPDLSRQTLTWRLFGSLGAYSLILGHPELLDLLFGGGTRDGFSDEQLRHHVLAFVTAGLGAPAPPSNSKD